MTLKPEDDTGRASAKGRRAPAIFFEGGEAEIPFPNGVESDGTSSDFGYALTVHKAQGSQWDDVMLFDESYAFGEHRNRWLIHWLDPAPPSV